jgi:hypothetical protein
MDEQAAAIAPEDRHMTTIAGDLPGTTGFAHIVHRSKAAAVPVVQKTIVI